MRIWQGMTRHEGADSDGSFYAQNTRYWIDGELQRRHGLTASSANSGTSLIAMKHPVTGYFTVYFRAGILTAVSA